MGFDVPPIQNKLYKNIVDAMVEARKNIGYTQAQVDFKIGCADGLVSKWECGDRIPSFFMLACWSEVLEVDIKVTSKKLEDSEE